MRAQLRLAGPNRPQDAEPRADVPTLSGATGPAGIGRRRAPRRDWLWRAPRRPAGFVRAIWRRFVADNCLSGAGALSYATLVSLVPLAAIVLSVFSAFQMFEGVRDRFLVVLLQMFAPEVGEEIAWAFQRFAGTAARTTTLGLIALAITSLVLLVTIEEHLNTIWHVETPRRWLDRILAYWAILTMGPLAVGAGISLTAYVDLAASSAGPGFQAVDRAAREALAALSWIIPFVLETGAFFALYRLIPNCRVRGRDGFAGALVAAALLEGLKLAMVVYVSEIAYYSRVYGALAGVPIFLLWLYVFWLAVLVGAEVAAHLSDGTGPRAGSLVGSWRAPRPSTPIPTSRASDAGREPAQDAR